MLLTDDPKFGKLGKPLKIKNKSLCHIYYKRDYMNFGIHYIQKDLRVSKTFMNSPVHCSLLIIYMIIKQLSI